MTETNIDTNEIGELTYRRIYEAPRELMFDCMTQPEHLQYFWGPAGTSAPIDRITVDLRPGGAFKTVMINEADGAEYPTHAVYVEVSRPDKLVWSEPDVEGGMTTSISFVDLGNGRTEVITHQTNVPEMYRAPENVAGMTSSFDRFAAYLATIA